MARREQVTFSLGSSIREGFMAHTKFDLDLMVS